MDPKPHFSCKHSIHLIKLKKALISNFCCSYDAVKNVKPAKEWRDEECEVSSRSLFDGSHLVISKTKLGDAGTYRYTAIFIRHSLHSSCTLSLNFPKLYFNLTKLPPHLSNFQKRVSEVSLFSSVIRKSVLVFLQGWIKKTFQMPRGLPAWSDNLRQQQAGRDPPAPGAGDLSGQSCHHQGPGGHLAPGQGGHQPRAGVQGEGRPTSAQPLLVDRQPPPGPAVHGVSWHYNTSKIVHTKCIE